MSTDKFYVSCRLNNMLVPVGLSYGFGISLSTWGPTQTNTYNLYLFIITIGLSDKLTEWCRLRLVVAKNNGEGDR